MYPNCRLFFSSKVCSFQAVLGKSGCNLHSASSTSPVKGMVNLGHRIGVPHLPWGLARCKVFRGTLALGCSSAPLLGAPGARLWLLAVGVPEASLNGGWTTPQPMLNPDYTLVGSPVGVSEGCPYRIVHGDPHNLLAFPLYSSDRSAP